MVSGSARSGIGRRDNRKSIHYMKILKNRIVRTLSSLGLSAYAGFGSQVEFKGLLNQSIGQATVQLDAAAGALTISGIGSNGTDGVSIATGSDGGGTLDLGRFDPAALPSGAFLRWRALDPSDNELQKLSVQATAGGGGAIFADFTGLGAQTVSVALYSNDTLVATATGIAPGTPVATFSSGTSGGGLPIILNPCILHPESCYGVIDVTVWQPDPAGPIGSSLSLPGQGPMLCTRLEISPGYGVPYFLPKYHVKSTEITGGNLGTQNIANEGLVYFGLEHHALGQAQYAFDPTGALNVILGPGGTDGVDIGLRNANTFKGDMVALNPQPLPPGPDPTILLINATGNLVGGTGEQTLGDLRVLALPTGMQLRAEMPAGSGGGFAVELWQGGTLVETYGVDVTTPALSFQQGFTSVSVGDPDDGPWCGTHPPGPPVPPWWWSVGWPTPIQVTTPGGGIFMVDHARMSPITAGQSLMGLTHVTFQGVGPQPLVFTGERAQRNGLSFQGNQHFALGNATLMAAGGQLMVNNMGEAGNGVEIVLGRVNGSEVTSPSLPLPPPGASVTYSVFADVDGIPDRPAGALTSQMNADGTLQLTGDFSAVGATHFTVAVLNGDALVARQTGLPTASFSIQTSNSPGNFAMSWKTSPNGNGGYMQAVRDSSDHDLLITQPFPSPVHGTRVVLIPEDPVHQLGPQTRLRITESGPVPSPYIIAVEKLNVFGHGHTALGSAYMTASDGLVNLGNLGIGGANGVSIDFCKSVAGSVTLVLDPSIVQGPQPLPWMLQTTAFGTISGQSNQPFGSLTFQATNGPVSQVTADFSPVGSPSQTIEVYNLGQLVQRIPGLTGPLGTVSATPVTVGVQDAGGANLPAFIVRFGQSISFNIAGGPMLQGDTLLVRPGSMASSLSSFQTLNLQAAGMNSLGIGYESDSAALTPQIGGIGRAPASGGMQISVPTVFGYLYTLEAASSLGPQPVPWTPVQTFLGDGTTKVISLSNPAYVGGPQGYFRVRLGNNSSGSPTGDPAEDMVFPKHVYFFMDNVIVDEPRDSGGDRPYFATVLFQTQGSTDGSTVVKVVDQPPHDWVSKPEFNGNGTLLKGIDHMLSGDMLPLPPWMGDMEWDNLQWHTIQDLQNNIVHPPIMVLGALVLALDNRNTPPDKIHDLLTQVATGLQQQLVAQVESGDLFKGITWLNQAQASQQLTARAIALANAALSKVQPDVVGLVVGSILDPDMPVGASLLLFPVVPGIAPQSSSATIIIPNFCSISVNSLERSPDNFSTTLSFRGCSAAYRVNARIVPDFVPPAPPQNNNQPDPTLVDRIFITTKTGDDDLRSSSTAQATISINGRSDEVFNLNLPNQGFASQSTQPVQTLILSSPAPFRDIVALKLHVVQGQCGGCTDDNWDVDGLTVQCSGPTFPRTSEPIVPHIVNKHIVRLVANDEHPENNEFVTGTFSFAH